MTVLMVYGDVVINCHRMRLLGSRERDDHQRTLPNGAVHSFTDTTVVVIISLTDTNLLYLVHAPPRDKK